LIGKSSVDNPQEVDRHVSSPVQIFMTIHHPSPIRVGIVGLGRAGIPLHLEPLRSLPQFEITAVCDPLPGKARSVAETAGRNARAFATLAELLASGCCDLVVIATPSQQHYREAKAVLDAGVDCILEKPMAGTGAEARELAALAKEKGRHLFVHHQYLFSDELLFLQEIIASGRLGEIFHIEAFWCSYQRRWDWQTLRANKGGQLLNTCPHIISLLLPLLGGDLDVESADLRLIKDAGDTEDHVRFSLRGRNGITASAMVTSVCALPMPRLTLFGSRGSLQENFVEAKLRYYDAAAVPALSVIDGAAPESSLLREELPWQEEALPVCPGQKRETFHEHVASVLLKGVPSRANADEAARVVEILETIGQLAHRHAPA